VFITGTIDRVEVLTPVQRRRWSAKGNAAIVQRPTALRDASVAGGATARYCRPNQLFAGTLCRAASVGGEWSEEAVPASQYWPRRATGAATAAEQENIGEGDFCARRSIWRSKKTAVSLPERRRSGQERQQRTARRGETSGSTLAQPWTTRASLGGTNRKPANGCALILTPARQTGLVKWQLRTNILAIGNPQGFKIRCSATLGDK
jgi:hypothetical protein